MNTAALRVVCGSANPRLTASVIDHLGVESDGCKVERFPDGELRPTIDNVCGADVYVIQSTAPPVNEHIVELMLLLDACRRSHAARVTAVLPYFGYARQDRRTASGQALGVSVVADAIARAGADRMVVVDPHGAALEAQCRIPVESLSAVPTLAGRLVNEVPEGSVVVAPDLGAAKLAERYAEILHGPVAVVRKQREDGSTVTALDIAGDVSGRPAVVIDDMISTGGTIEAAVELLRRRGATPDILVAATHGLFVHDAAGRLRDLELRRVVVADTVEHDETDTLVEVCSIAPVLAAAIGCMYDDKPVGAAVTQVQGTS
ncbi:ribose-phosphate diphosphokinase [Mycolicibacterium elephantis]|uniref:ribose-phosphate diphosphokinase n=1 Tax=Mycolicibacterium elephantis DSM 44368 TaxID=1335622 RepID=A0A439E0I6_9MYCO|nr:ribose-phosphate pyrophosphokinase [Mycolicibacterium elephantis]MCV7221501.1 ribose-phosphate pyrophosphokinase [Mycolicibacterium elephantis]RWA23944.1 ribose-phosphate pyrophosphokinase [Mycolicibacterium elephantis DSM 44368]